MITQIQTITSVEFSVSVGYSTLLSSSLMDPLWGLFQASRHHCLLQAPQTLRLSLRPPPGKRTSEPQLSYLSEGNNNYPAEGVPRARGNGVVPAARGTHPHGHYCQVMVVVAYSQ